MSNDAMQRLTELADRLYAPGTPCTEHGPLRKQMAELRAEIYDSVKVIGEGADLLRRVLTGITTGELNWRQGTWLTVELDADRHPCKTYGCVAGWLSMLSGGTPNVTGACAYESDVREGWVITVAVDLADAVEVPVWKQAAAALGVDPDDSAVEYVLNDLFNGANSLARLWGCAARLTRGEVTVPAELHEIVHGYPARGVRVAP